MLRQRSLENNVDDVDSEIQGGTESENLQRVA